MKKLLTNCIYLQNEAITIDELTIFGCPLHAARKKISFSLKSKSMKKLLKLSLNLMQLLQYKMNLN